MHMQTAADMHMQTVTRAVEITKPRRAEDHFKILKHIEFLKGGSKIQDCAGFLGGILDSRRAVLKYSGHIQSQYHKSKIPDPRFLPLDLGSAILKLNVAQYLDVAI